METKITKIIEHSGEWKECVFVRMQHTYKLKDWCKENYGNPKYLGSWYELGLANVIILREEVYTHWKLYE